MSDDYPSLYSDARRYDLVEGAFATVDLLDFYKRQIAVTANLCWNSLVAQAVSRFRSPKQA